jgi:hypothetical protein
LAALFLAQGQGRHIETARDLLAPLATESIVSYRAWRMLRLVEERMGRSLPQRTMHDRKFCRGSRAFFHTELYEQELHSRLAHHSNFRRLGACGTLVHKHAHRQSRTSIILSSAGGHGVAASLRCLGSQLVPREQFEVIVAECFDAICPESFLSADVVLSCNMPLYLEHRSIALNAAFTSSCGEIVVFVAAGENIPPSLIGSIAAKLTATSERKAIVLENPAYGVVLATRRTDVQTIGGFDEAEPLQGETLYIVDAILRLIASGVEMIWIERGPIGKCLVAGSLVDVIAMVRSPAASQFMELQWPKIYGRFQKPPSHSRPSYEPVVRSPLMEPSQQVSRRMRAALFATSKSLLRRHLPAPLYMRLGSAYQRARRRLRL